MNRSLIHRRNFQLYLQDRPDYDRPLLVKEPAGEQPVQPLIDQLQNEYTITRQLAGVHGVRSAVAKEGTVSQPVLLLEYIKGQSLAELILAASLRA